MSDNQTKGGLSKLRDVVGPLLEEIQEARQAREEKKKEERSRRQKVSNNYAKWLEELRPEAEKSARIIFDWVNALVKSDDWDDFCERYSGLINYLDISENIIYDGPSPNPYYPYGEQGHQSLSVDLRGRLYVHNNVKYGKTYELSKPRAILENVRFPVIIKIAKTITDGTIWTIIERQTRLRFSQNLDSARKQIDDTDFFDLDD